jgi:hypothetical protein
MSRTVAPLLSFEASGQIAKTQVYSKWKGRPYVRRYTVPSNPKTTAQTETRNTFKWLNDVWKFMPGSAVAAWQLYALNNRFTDRNGFIKVNLSPLRSQTDLTNFTFSPSAGSGLAAQAMNLTAGSEQITVALTEPALPNGWTITEAVAAAIKQQDPQTGTDFIVTADVDASTPFSIVLTGLEATQEYVVGGWFKFTKPDGSFAYGQSLMDTATPTA